MQPKSEGGEGGLRGLWGRAAARREAKQTSKGETQVIQWSRPEGFVHAAVLSRELRSPFLETKVCFISFASED